MNLPYRKMRWLSIPHFCLAMIAAAIIPHVASGTTLLDCNCNAHLKQSRAIEPFHNEPNLAFDKFMRNHCYIKSLTLSGRAQSAPLSSHRRDTRRTVSKS